ncbi:hypothetical protein HYH03_017066 [Edaphochlamys debaryana]|uniref:Uncharacterized protein n=1 Tax=Edaphochlamys debaryana TaxID=47281 RepID=A0A835XNE3_9CHLO|nr:hypothetical protein HYH03_017066 [Edaphochlamys debaryana]|eukprot:KAG2484115.1 hypothetical protein HYH03_017066 [Edaphochlamys debaryana]
MPRAALQQPSRRGALCRSALGSRSTTAAAGSPSAGGGGRGKSTSGGGGSTSGSGSGGGGGGSSGGGGALTPVPAQRLDLPIDLRTARHFVNLTNGIEALPVLHQLGLPYSFVRIQSTACEQQNLEALVSELDANLLVSLALGHCCLVYDCGSRAREGTPRALWYGLEFVRYCLSRSWLKQSVPVQLRGHNAAREFEGHVRKFKQSTSRRLAYYARYLPPGGLPYGVRLHGVFRPTGRDEDTAFFVRTLHDHQLPYELSYTPLEPSLVPSLVGPSLREALAPLAAGPGPGRGHGRGDGQGQVPGPGPGAPPGLDLSQGEAVLREHGFRVFRRGLTNAEFAAAGGPPPLAE